MKSLMLAAGLGRRLYGNENTELPKALLSFDGESLLYRHIMSLKACGVDELLIVVGHRSEEVVAEAKRVAPAGFIKFVYNPRYREGPILSLSCGAEVLRDGSSVIFMDSDVLYHPDILYRLFQSKHETCLVLDHEFQSTHDFVKVCLLNDAIVDFGKDLSRDYDTICEWPGVIKMSSAIAAQVADAADQIIQSGKIEGAYERAICSVLHTEPKGTFGYEDISGIPWIEIDCESDLEKAVSEVFPRISKLSKPGQI